MNMLIIGGSSTIGQYLVRNLSENGHHCLVISRSPANIQHERITWIETDIIQEPFPDEILPEKLEGLVYLPGTIQLKPFRALKEEHFKEAWEINFTGAVKSIQAAEKSLKKSGNASIVLFSTVAVQTGMPFHAVVSSVKGAIEGLTRSLAAEFAPNVRVNSIALSLTDTRMAERFLSSEEKRNASRERHPLKDIGNPEDVAALTEFLLEKHSRWITGQVIKADGGIGSLRIN